MNTITSIPDNIFNPAPSQNTPEVKLDSIDPVNRFYCLKATLVNPLFNRNINSLYKYQFPENWLDEYVSTMSLTESMSVNSYYRIKLIPNQ